MQDSILRFRWGSLFFALGMIGFGGGLGIGLVATQPFLRVAYNGAIAGVGTFLVSIVGVVVMSITISVIGGFALSPSLKQGRIKKPFYLAFVSALGFVVGVITCFAGFYLFVSTGLSVKDSLAVSITTGVIVGFSEGVALGLARKEKLVQTIHFLFMGAIGFALLFVTESLFFLPRTLYFSAWFVFVGAVVGGSILGLILALLTKKKNP